jgi:hypothetical protein
MCSLQVRQRGIRCDELCAHFLQARSKPFHLLLQLCGSPLLFELSLLFDKGVVLTEELIEQHRIHSVVSYAMNVSCRTRLEIASILRPAR